MTQRILNKIIKPQYRQKLSDWQHYINQSQKLGLDIIQQIYNCKGNKKVNVTLPVQKIMYETHNSLMNRKGQSSLQEAQQKYRRKQLTTSYQYFHGYSLQKNNKGNIFAYKTLQKLDLAKALTPIAVSFIDNWLSLKDLQKYEEYVLACLRSIKSKLDVAIAGSTQVKTVYNWKQDRNLSKPLRMDKICQDLFVFKPNLPAIKRQQQKQRQYRSKIAQIQKSDFAKQIAIFKDFKIN